MRRKDREVTNIIEILQIIEKAKVLHLALFDADYPYIVPLHYGYEYTEGILIFYMHCAKEGHKLDLIRSNPNVCILTQKSLVRDFTMFALPVALRRRSCLRLRRKSNRALRLEMTK